MKILITGINGFVGKHLAERLKSEPGCDIYGLDIQKNSNNIEENNYFCCDITNESQINKIIKTILPEVVFHLAGFSAIKQCSENPAVAFNINTGGFVNLLCALRVNNLKTRVMFISSAQVYGNPLKNIPITESFPINPLNEYAASKACAEIIGRQYVNSYDMDIVFLRPFNHFGPGQGTGFVIPDICSQVAKIEQNDKDSDLFIGNTDVHRDFLDVRDVVDAYVLAVKKCKKGLAYNICSGEPVYIKDILDFILGLSTSRINVKSRDFLKRNKEIDKLFGDNLLFITETRWKPRYKLESSLSDTLDYWRKNTCFPQVIHRE